MQRIAIYKTIYYFQAKEELQTSGLNQDDVIMIFHNRNVILSIMGTYYPLLETKGNVANGLEQGIIQETIKQIIKENPLSKFQLPAIEDIGVEGLGMF